MQIDNSEDTKGNVSKNDEDKINKEILENLLTESSLSKLHLEPNNRDNKTNKDEQSN